MPLDHFSIVVPEGKLEDLVSWLLASNALFGFKEITRPVTHAVGMGEDRPYFWAIGDATTEASEAQVKEWRKQHVAFTVKSRWCRSVRRVLWERFVVLMCICLGVEQVHEWHEVAIRAGGEDNGKPGPRPEYHPGYYGAFVRDPVLGINYEVVYREPDRRNMWANESTS